MNAFRDVRVLTEAALAIALAFVLGLIKVFQMPMGGSISLEMIPLILLYEASILLARRFGQPGETGIGSAEPAADSS